MKSFVCVVVLALGACKGNTSKAPLDQVFGKSVEPPAGMAAIKPGMTLDQAKSAVPDLKAGEAAAEGSWMKHTGRSGVAVFVVLQDKTVTALRTVIAEKENDVVAALEKAWGKPAAGTEWHDENTGWRAQLDCKKDVPCNLDFTAYTPPKPEAKADLFPAKIGPPVAVASIKTFEEAQKVPGMTKEFSLELADGVVVQLGSDRSGNVGSYSVTATEAVKEMLTKQWGAPQEGGPAAKAVASWSDPATGWRAWLVPGAQMGSKSAYVLSIGTFTPMTTLLGTGPDIAALPTPILGATKDDILKAYPTAVARDEEKVTIGFPATEHSDYPTIVKVELDEGKATTMEIDLPFQPQGKDAVFALLKQKWGEPKKDPERPTPTWVFKAKRPRIEAVDRHDVIGTLFTVRWSKD